MDVVKEAGMGDYYNSGDLDRFGEVGKYKPELFKKFMDWYQATLEGGALTKREKALIGLGVAHAIQCPYCIDAFTRECIAEGMDMDHITEAIHTASAVRGGAALIHGLQAGNVAEKILL